MNRALKTPYTAPVSKEIRAQICQMIMQSPPIGGSETPGEDEE
jgi:hypothetical protein